MHGTPARRSVHLKYLATCIGASAHCSVPCGCLAFSACAAALSLSHASGIELRGKERRTRGIDYNAEVAFERKPVPGFYDTGEEARQTREMQQEFRPTTVEEMEGKRRKVGPGCRQLGWRVNPGCCRC